MSADRALRDNKIGALSLPKPLCVSPSTSLREALHMVRKAGVGALVVVENGKVIGLLTEREVLMKVVARGVDYGRQVKEFMTPNPTTMTRDRQVTEAVSLLNREPFPHLPIVDRKGAPVAMLRMTDIIEYFAEAFPEEVLNLPPRPHQVLETPEGA